MLWVLENFGDLLGEFIRLRIKPYLWLRFIVVKGCKAESVKGNGMWRTSGGNQLEASKSPHPWELDQKCLIPPTTSCNNTCKMYIPGEFCLRLRVQDFCWRSFTKACYTLDVPKCENSRRKFKYKNINYVVQTV